MIDAKPTIRLGATTKLLKIVKCMHKMLTIESKNKDSQQNRDKTYTMLSEECGCRDCDDIQQKEAELREHSYNMKEMGMITWMDDFTVLDCH